MQEILSLLTEAQRLCAGEYPEPSEKLFDGEEVVGQVPLDLQPVHGLWVLTVQKLEYLDEKIKQVPAQDPDKFAIEYGQLKHKEVTLRAIICHVLAFRFPKIAAAAKGDTTRIAEGWKIAFWHKTGA